jgi:hypothetical protein
MLTDPGHAVVAAAPGGKIPAVDRAQRSQSGGATAIQPR